MGAIIIGIIGRRVPRARLASIGALGLGLLVMALAATRSLSPALVVLALSGACMATAGISTATSLQLAATPEVRGRVMAVYSFVVLGLTPIGALQVGWVAEHLGAEVAVAASGAIALLGMLRLRRRLWYPVEE
jgi:MFS family permease